MSTEVNDSIRCHRRAYVVAHTSRYAEGLEAGGLCFSLPLPIFRAMIFFLTPFQEVSCSKDFLYLRLGLQLVRRLRDAWTKMVAKTSVDEPLN